MLFAVPGISTPSRNRATSTMSPTVSVDLTSNAPENTTTTGRPRVATVTVISGMSANVALVVVGALVDPIAEADWSDSGGVIGKSKEHLRTSL